VLFSDFRFSKLKQQKRKRRRVIIIFIMGKSKQQQQEDSSSSSTVECPTGLGGYQLLVYKNNNLKKASPMSEEGYQYVKSKFKKHSGVQAQHKAIQKQPKQQRQRKQKAATAAAAVASGELTPSTTSVAASASAPVGEQKPKRKLTPAQLENLKRGREKRAANLAAAAVTASTNVSMGEAE
jgi:hypothetical protein